MTTLMEIIEKFAETRSSNGAAPESHFRGRGLDTPAGAYCMCDSTSDAFITFARAAGYDGRLARYDFNIDISSRNDAGVREYSYDSRNPDPTLYTRGQHDTANFAKAGWHTIVETEEFLLDFTAKQYHSQACYPHIISRAVAHVPVFGHHVDVDDKLAEQIAKAVAAGGN